MHAVQTLHAPPFDWPTICRTKIIPKWSTRPGEYSVSVDCSGVVQEAGTSSAGKFVASGGLLAHGLVAGTVMWDFNSPVCTIRPGSDWLTVHVIASGYLCYDGGSDQRQFRQASAGQAVVQYRASDRSYALQCPADQHVSLISIACDPNQLASDFQIPGGVSRLRSVFESLNVVDLNAKAMRAAHDIMDIDLAAPMALVRYQAKSLDLLAILMEPLLMQGQSIAEPTEGSARNLRPLFDARALLDLHFESPPTVADLAARVGTNRTKLMRGFKSQFGVTIADYTLRRRMERARELLLDGELGIAQVGYRVGYQHHSSFTAAFANYFGESPSATVEKARLGLDTRFAPQNLSDISKKAAGQSDF